MKKLRFLPVVALALAIGASAFTTRKTTSDVWYVFNSTNYSEVNDPDKYVSTEEENSPGCTTLGNICAIKLPDNGLHPDADDFENLRPAIEASQLGESSTDSRIEMEE